MTDAVPMIPVHDPCLLELRRAFAQADVHYTLTEMRARLDRCVWGNGLDREFTASLMKRAIKEVREMKGLQAALNLYRG